MDNGFILLHRSILEWEWWKNLNVRCLWITLLLMASWDEKRKEGQQLQPGQLITTYPQLASVSGLSYQSVRTALNHLKSTGELTVQRADNSSLITIANWALYQQEGGKKKHKSTDKQTVHQQTANRPLTDGGGDTLYKNKGNNITKEEGSAEQTSFSPPPVISLPLNDGTEYEIYNDDVLHWNKLYPAVDILQQLRNMYGWLDSNPKQRKTRAGIKRFVNRWLAKEQDSGKSNSTKSRKTFVDLVNEMQEENL